MPMLENVRWENFAQHLAMGKKQIKAYQEAGFKPNSKSANKLAQNEVIQARVTELRQVALQNNMLTIERVSKELEKIGFANMMDFIKIDNEGNPEIDMRTIDRDKAAAIGEITTDVITNPRDGSVTKRTKFKLLDKKGALVDLGRYLGMFVERKQVQHAGVMFHVNADDMNL